MEPLLQPLRTTQLLDRAVHLYRRHLLFFMLLCLPTVLVVMVAGEAGRRVPLRIPANNPLLYMIGWMFSIIAYSASCGATSAAVVFALRGFETGQVPTVIGCLRQLRGYTRRILGIESLQALRMFGVVFGGFLVPVLGAGALALYQSGRLLRGPGVLITIGFVFILLILMSMFWMVHIYARHSFAAVSCVVENTGIRASLKRSRILAKGSLRRVWIVFFFALCVYLPISIVVNLPAAMARQWVRHHRSVFMAWDYAGEFFAMLISVPIVVIGTTLIYYDQRVRREALDVETLIVAAEAANAAHPIVQLPIVDEPVAAAAVAEEADSVIADKPDDPPEPLAASSGS
jgi:hypothetical protein